MNTTKSFSDQIFGQLTRMNESEALRSERDKLKIENEQMRTILRALFKSAPEMAVYVATLNAARDLLPAV